MFSSKPENMAKETAGEIVKRIEALRNSDEDFKRFECFNVLIGEVFRRAMATFDQAKLIALELSGEQTDEWEEVLMKESDSEFVDEIIGKIKPVEIDELLRRAEGLPGDQERIVKSQIAKAREKARGDYLPFLDDQQVRQRLGERLDWRQDINPEGENQEE